MPPKTFTELQIAYNASIDAQQAILDAAKAEDRDITEEERTQFDALETESNELKSQMDVKQADVARQERLTGRERQTPAPIQRPSPTQPNSRVEVIQPEDDGRAGFRNDRDFLMAVIANGCGSGMDNRLVPLREKAAAMNAAAGTDEQQEGANAWGGFAVPLEFMPNMLQIAPEDNEISTAMNTTKIPMASNMLEIPARTDKDHSSSVSGGITVTRKAETNAAASSRMQMERVRLTAYKLSGLAFITDELLQDSAISIPALIQTAMNDEFTSTLIQERLFGTGVGEFSGVVGHVATVNVAKEANQPAATINTENVVKMRARCWRYGDAIWLANHDTIPQLFKLQQAIGTGGVQLYMPSIREDMPDVLMGRPIFYTENTKTLGTVGDLVLGNWTQYLEGIRSTVQGDVSAHVRFINSEQTFRFVLRNAGLPWWRSPLTPKNGATLSPFVTLATRG